ncbi:MAG: hypothetical protein ABFE16_13910 [Armatimonadia bacterium]
MSCLRAMCGSLILVFATGACAAPKVAEEPGWVSFETDQYRARLSRDYLAFTYELKGTDGIWRSLTKPGTSLGIGILAGSQVLSSENARATWAMETRGNRVLVARQASLDPVRGMVVEAHYVFTDEGMLMGTRLSQREGALGSGSVWTPPRITLEPAAWSGYRYWSADGEVHQGDLASLQPLPAYAGVSPWGTTGDTTNRFDQRRPALIVTAAEGGMDLGVVYSDYAGAWQGTSGFVQRHTPSALYLYAGFVPAQADKTWWSWLAPIPAGSAAEQESRVLALVQESEAALRDTMLQAPPIPEEWSRPVPDFPTALRRPEPVQDIRDAVVYTVNEDTASDYGVTLARKVGSDVLIRGWFKWRNAPAVSNWTDIPPQVHKLGALFGGGITCSALYDDENGLSQAQVLDMATRGPDGQLIDAWDQPGTRHGSLSSAAYLDYLFRWCKEQIDAGADYLFMDENTAALSGLEGYDDHSLEDFRTFLLTVYPQTQGWTAKDSRWAEQFGIDLADTQMCPDGTMAGFSYRAYLRKNSFLTQPQSANNRLAGAWREFRTWRDDRAWKALTDRIRDYGRSLGRKVLISGNGIVRYVDLQVLGVWGAWSTDSGHIDLRENQLPRWRGLVQRGQQTAGSDVPVVLFHDWGFGTPPFPWMAVPADERAVWMRTRGAEIYAAGGFFAFPVLGPFACDAGRDGTLGTIAQQTAFYQSHLHLYLKSRWLCTEPLKGDREGLSLAAWWNEASSSLLLHVVNRDVQQGQLRPQEQVKISVPVGAAPVEAKAVSPDFEGSREVVCRLVGENLEVTLPSLEAYSLVLLRFEGQPDLGRLKDPARTHVEGRWQRPQRSEFRVLAEASIENGQQLEGYLQGMLHTELRNPPTFEVNAVRDAQLAVYVQAVATAGAKLEFRVDGKTVQTVDLPDLDGKNGGNSPEYCREFVFPIPAGRHRVTLDNVGGDWACLTWYEFRGTYATP